MLVPRVPPSLTSLLALLYWISKHSLNIGDALLNCRPLALIIVKALEMDAAGMTCLQGTVVKQDSLGLQCARKQRSSVFCSWCTQCEYVVQQPWCSERRRHVSSAWAGCTHHHCMSHDLASGTGIMHLQSQL